MQTISTIAYIGLILANMVFTTPNINPPVHPTIRTNPVITVGSCGKVNSLAKLRPIGTIGTMIKPAMNMLMNTSQ